MSTDSSNPILRRLGVAGVGDERHFRSVEGDCLELLELPQVSLTERYYFRAIPDSESGGANNPRGAVRLPREFRRG